MLVSHSERGKRVSLHSPIKLPKASAFLWNKRLMIHMNCRGYAVAQFMQPEPAKYAHAPNLEAKTFMQPEQPYYAHHPGRFFYIKNEETGDLFSAPFAPCKVPLDNFEFSAGLNDIIWEIEKDQIFVRLKLSLPVDDLYEIWEIEVINRSNIQRKLSIYPYFTIGYMSWMNQSGHFQKEINAIVGHCISPYQKYQDYDKVRNYHDKTFLISKETPDAWEVNQEAFEGDSGLHHPAGVLQSELSKGEAVYETPVGAMQFRVKLAPGKNFRNSFLFGAANEQQEVNALSEKFRNNNYLQSTSNDYRKYVEAGHGCLEINTPDKEFDHFVNHWLPRQIYYHGTTNRLSTDPQTRNFLQDHMGMSYIQPEVARASFLIALSQQKLSGAMPDGILVHPEAELKYINQVPHTDHCVWLPICLRAYLDETGDYQILNEKLPFADSDQQSSVFDHISMAMRWLVNNRDERGLNYINQGDWCDPMNMVGYKGKGVSGWLTMGTTYALLTWVEICTELNQTDEIQEFDRKIKELQRAINNHLWDGKWYARGITDDNVKFGTSKDNEGRIFLNTQAWSMLAECADRAQQVSMIEEVAQQLESPFGVELLAPAFTSMREDIGRVTQKFPGSAENGSVYNHAAAFYVYSLYVQGFHEVAFKVLRKMLPMGEEDLVARGQLPVFIPNYYRGAFKQYPATAGRSSQLFNTGTVHWLYRCIIDGLLGLKGTKEGLLIQPNLPPEWSEIQVIRVFRGADFIVKIKRGLKSSIFVDGQVLNDNCITEIQVDHTYHVQVVVS